MRTIPQVGGVPIEVPRVLSFANAQRLGFTRSALDHAVRAHGWRRLTRGIFLTVAGDATRDDWALVGLESAGPHAAVSGWDAVRTHGLGARVPPTAEVLVLDRAGRHRVIEGVRIRPTARLYHSAPLPWAHPTLPGVPIVGAARAVADTALLYPTVAPVRALVTSAVQRGRCTPDELVREFQHCPRNDSWPLHCAVQDALDGARSIAEAEAVDALRQSPVPAFELNVPVHDPFRGRLYVVDLLWRELRAVAEIDSREYHFTEQEWKATSSRHNRLTASGVAVAHYPPSEIRGRGRAWGADVAAWLRNRAAEVGVAYVPHPVPVRPGPDGPAPFMLPTFG